MSLAAQPLTGERRFVIDGVGWQTYKALRDDVERHGVRMTFDGGTLELMSPSRAHERLAELIGMLAREWAAVCRIPISSCGSVTMRRDDLEKGCEPDKGFYIEHEALMRGHDDYDPEIHPPPDLVVEVDITSPSVRRMPIYAALGVPEVWQHDGETLRFHTWADGEYSEQTHSRSFPELTPADVLRFVEMRHELDERSLVAEFAAWARTTLPPP